MGRLRTISNMAPSSNPPDKAARLDHVGFIVADLEACCRLISQLGFRLTERAEHRRTLSSGELVSAGSAQRSAMLHNGYIEFMQITDPQAGHQLNAAVAVRFGLHVLALGTDDAQACQAARLESGVRVGPLLNWSRRIDQDECVGLARFRYFDSVWNPHDPSYICWVEHLTPELLRPARLLQHDNGALALREIHYRGARRHGPSWTAQLAAAGAQIGPGSPDQAQLLLDNARIQVGFDEGEQSMRPSALVLEFSACGWLRARCLELGLALQERDGGAIEVDLVQQIGLRLICRPTNTPDPVK
jgi:catechol 2,3-dioxygenase-like lactoylglutathione lyase family enzyme